MDPFVETDNEYDYFFVLDFCEHFKAYSGRTDCKSMNETLEVMNQIRIEFKISTQIWNVATYVMNGHEMMNQFETANLVLNRGVFQRQAYRLHRENIQLRNSYLVNWSFQTPEKAVAYYPQPQLSSIFPHSEKEFSGSSNP